ncbi:ribonuclease H [Candidatus Dojkabacteria bacterium CG_4_9_14_3_um_filter_150_Dojkabacteria_WS6_41_13]|uniref:Ribonuclease H n=1 Tax=Candidatus Dojkabacteria bacterium CG_4_10_14_0_2_um_filter_Dojkabacteria_WS6_41_15 TaxID=2014249 RepID=A0A2M7W2V4_9BACT|nr:MAG: ribonuclease H [Candidatus Dojkabacteria bacterium CG_4_10_14_0_2_um_filter_Dojkabacteria_WS6_41_15]PJB22847.1 MAG: ribonuclease H [Candidatus Dojkabacteria bacterium CG_4_9_14_3_um_filter_150_Dojkabacteria_WS6_41_13]
MTQKKFQKLQVFTDGGSRNNPGNAGIGFVLMTPEGVIIDQMGKYIGIATNNEAEYQALLTALQHIKNFHSSCKELTIYSDSELMVKQLLRVYKIKEPHLRKFAEVIWELLDTIADWQIKHVLRDKNQLADQLVNEALDKQLCK